MLKGTSLNYSGLHILLYKVIVGPMMTILVRNSKSRNLLFWGYKLCSKISSIGKSPRYISVPNRKFPVQYWILGIFLEFSRNFKFGNSRFIFGTETGREMASPKWRDWDRTRKRMFPNAWDGKFPRFFREKSGSRKMAFGNADLYPWCWPLFTIFISFNQKRTTSHSH